MENKGKGIIQSKPALWKQMLGYAVVLLFALFAFIYITHSWLDRTTQTVEGAGFSLTNSGTIMEKRYSIETYYLDQDQTWKLITSDFERQPDILDDGTVDWASFAWDEDSALLVPGSKTEFKTVVTNYAPYEQSVSLYLQGITVDIALQKLILFGATSPQVHVYAAKDDEDFTTMEVATDGTVQAVTPDSGLPQVRVANQLPICLREKLLPDSTLTIRWYVNTGTDVVGGNFPALMDSEGEYIMDGEYYYFVNLMDEDGVPTEAYKCDSLGVVILDSENDEYEFYTGDFSQTSVSNKKFGNMDQTVSVSGIYVGIG